MLDRSDHLFAYGTLMPGFHNHHRIAGHVRCSRPGTVQGVLLDLGAFPAMIRGEGRVRGMLLEIDVEALTIADFIEGYHPDHGCSLYFRERVQVELTNGQAVDAWIYFFANPDHIQDRPRLIVGSANNASIYSWPAE